MKFMCLMCLKSILWCGFSLAWVGNHESVTSVSVNHLEGTQRSPNWPNNQRGHWMAAAAAVLVVPSNVACVVAFGRPCCMYFHCSRDVASQEVWSVCCVGVKVYSYGWFQQDSPGTVLHCLVDEKSACLDVKCAFPPCSPADSCWLFLILVSFFCAESYEYLWVFSFLPVFFHLLMQVEQVGQQAKWIAWFILTELRFLANMLHWNQRIGYGY